MRPATRSAMDTEVPVASLKKRGDTYHAQWYVGTKQKRASLKTDSLQVAKERLRRIESRLAQGVDDPLPTRTPVAALEQDAQVTAGGHIHEFAELVSGEMRA